MPNDGRILIYEGRRFLRPETGPKVEGAKEAGFESLPRVIIVSVLVAAFMIVGGVWFAGKVRNGEIPFDGYGMWLGIGIIAGPIFVLLGVALANSKKPKQKPELPPNSVVLLSTLVSQIGKTTLAGSLELVNGLIRVVGENHMIEINRLEVESVKIVEGRVRLVIPKFHSLPAMHIILCPVNEESGNLMVKRDVIKDLVSRIESMPTSTLPSTYPRIEFREFQRPPGTLFKCALAGLLIWASIEALFGMTERNDPPGASFFAASIMTLFVVVLTFGDVWTAKSSNKWLRKKGIVRD